MKKWFAASVLATVSLVANAENYATCILDKMPGSVNEAFTGSVYSECAAAYPSTGYSILKGSGRGLFGFKDGNACVQKKSKDTPNQRAAMMIAFACRCLYNQATFEEEMCAYRP